LPRSVTGSTDWQSIATLYDGLVAHAPSLGAQVARAAAHGSLHGAAHGLDLLEQILEDRVTEYQPYWATRAHLLDQLGRSDEARADAARAASLSSDPAVRDHLRRIARGADGEDGPELAGQR
jgi:RNA polymerase sigma-70 factor (ECF subfamily)